LSIIDSYRKIDASIRFLIAFPFWLLVLFGLFYWGKYWNYSPFGEAIDSLIRSLIMPILDTILNNPIIDYAILINPKYRIIITPECNGLIPYLMILAAILAYPCRLSRKLFWGVLAFVIMFIMNIIRLYIVVEVVNIYGTKYFYLIHDIVGNMLLIITGALIFLRYLKGCSEE
jgi:exosortase/archaeosortase family protein